MGLSEQSTVQLPWFQITHCCPGLPGQGDLPLSHSLLSEGSIPTLPLAPVTAAATSADVMPQQSHVGSVRVKHPCTCSQNGDRRGRCGKRQGTWTYEKGLPRSDWAQVTISSVLFWVSKMAQWVKASAGKSDNPGSIPGGNGDLTPSRESPHLHM